MAACVLQRTSRRSEILHRDVLEGSIAEAEREVDREVPAFVLPAVKFIFQRLRMRVDAQATKLFVCYTRTGFSPPPFENEDEYHFTVKYECNGSRCSIPSNSFVF